MELKSHRRCCILSSYLARPSNKQHHDATTSAGEQLRKGTNVSEGSDDFPPFFDDFSDYRDFCISYRSDLSTIIRQTSALLPEPALAAAVRRLQSALQLCSTSGASLQVRAECATAVWIDVQYQLILVDRVAAVIQRFPHVIVSEHLDGLGHRTCLLLTIGRVCKLPCFTLKSSRD